MVNFILPKGAQLIVYLATRTSMQLAAVVDNIAIIVHHKRMMGA